MAEVTLEDIQRNPLEYLHRVKAGETLIIIEAGQAVAELKPVATPLTTPRPIGLAEGLFEVPEDFDAPLPDEVLTLLKEKEIMGKHDNHNRLQIHCAKSKNP